MKENNLTYLQSQINKIVPKQSVCALKARDTLMYFTLRNTKMIVQDNNGQTHAQTDRMSGKERRIKIVEDRKKE